MPTTEQPDSRKRNWLIAGGILLVAVFLAGFIPEHIRISSLTQQLRTRDERIDQLQEDAQLSRIRDLAGMLFLEISRKNYGVATQRATNLFDLIRAVIGNQPGAAIKSGLEKLLNQRDDIIAKLAKPDPSVQTDAANLLDQLFQLTFK
jgi:hypothetical protein